MRFLLLLFLFLFKQSIFANDIKSRFLNANESNKYQVINGVSESNQSQINRSAENNPTSGQYIAILEPYFFGHYTLNSFFHNTVDSISYSSIFAKHSPVGFGGTFGFYINDLFLIEMDISGSTTLNHNTSDTYIKSSTMNFAALRLTGGMKLAITPVQDFSILLLFGGLFGIKDVSYSYNTTMVPSSILHSTFGIAPEAGLGFIYNINQRIAIRSDARFAFVNSDKTINNIITFNTGIVFKF